MSTQIQDIPDSQNAARFIISVESQKGGVGKTTVSLALASLLLKRSWQVLIIDADLVGTALKIPATASLWGSITHSMSRQDGSDIELMALYQNWLSGSGIPNVEYDSGPAKPDARTLFAQSSKVNFISCEPIDPDQSLMPMPQENELNAELLAEFLVQLSSSFITGAMSQDSNGVAVILDNSPGSHGLVNSIETRLSLIGPKLGKFIFVAGPESHDLRATGMAINRAHEKLARKIRAIQLFMAIGENGTHRSRDISGLNDSDLEFLATLAQTPNHADHLLDSIYDDLVYKSYFTATLDAKAMPTEPAINEYIYVLINQVPAWINPVQIERLIANGLPNLQKNALANKHPGVNCVSYINRLAGLEAQAIQDSDLADTTGVWASDSTTRRVLHHLRKSSVMLHAKGKDLKEALWLRRTGEGAIEDLLSYLNKLIREMEREVGTGLECLTRHVDPALGRAIQPEWLPENFNYRLRKYLSQNMFHDGSLNDPNILTTAKPIPKGAISAFADAYRRVVKGKTQTDLPDNYLRNTLCACIFASVPLTISNDVLVDLADLSRVISKNLERRWRSHRPHSIVKMPSALWISEQKPNEDIINALAKNISSQQEGIEFYSALIEAAGRLVDLPTDCSLLLGAFGKIIVAAHNSATSIPPILQVLKEVIQDKSLVLDEKLEILDRTKLASHTAEALEKVLLPCVVRWTSS